MRPAVFLDRDGVINRDTGYVHRPDQLEFLPGVGAAIRALNRAGYWVIVVTNQSGVARGFFGEEAVDTLHRYMSQQLARHAARVDQYYYCPFHPVHGQGQYRRQSSWRKPGIGMFEQALRDFSIEVGRSWMVGDAMTDMEFARKAGLQAIFVGPASADLPASGTPRRCSGLRHAIEVILSHGAGRSAPAALANVERRNRRGVSAAAGTLDPHVQRPALHGAVSNSESNRR